MVTLKDILNAAGANEGLKKLKLTVEGEYVVDYKDWNDQLQLIRAENGIHSDDLVTVEELLKVFTDVKFFDMAIADEDGKTFEQAAATKTKLDFRYE